MPEEVSTDTIIASLRDIVQSKQPLPPERYINAGMMLTALLGGENDLYAELYQKAHLKMVNEIDSGKSASEAEARMKASKEYEAMLKQKGKVEQVQEMIRLAKIRSQLSSSEMKLGEI